MSFLSKSSNICYFKVVGEWTVDVLRVLAENRFRSIIDSAAELSSGWVHMDNYDRSDFTDDFIFRADRPLCFAFRQDRRKIPGAVFKKRVKELSIQFLDDKPTMNRGPKAEMEGLRDQARSELLSRTLPVPTCTDIVWDTNFRLLRFCSLSQNIIEAFQGLFHQSFPGLRLQIIHPLSKATMVVTEPMQARLEKLNQAQTDSALEQIEANRWIGWDFLRWLFYRTVNTDSRYSAKSTGPILPGQPFTAFIDRRLVMVGYGQEGAQKVVVAGPQDHYSEVRSALEQGKQIEEATIILRLDDDDLEWKLTLKGERFQFGSFNTPMIKVDQDPADDPAAEAEAAFFAKLGAVETGEQLFDSLLRSFLDVRLDDEKWREESKADAFSA